MTFRDPETGFVREIFPAFEGASLEFYRHVIPVGVGSGDLPSHKIGFEKYILMERGRLRVVLGEEEYLLEEGDVFYFTADATHRFENAGQGECSYFLVKGSGG